MLRTVTDQPVMIEAATSTMVPGTVGGFFRPTCAVSSTQGKGLMPNAVSQ